MTVYTPHKPALPRSAEELRQAIPGWGADLNPADRPAVPRESYDPSATGAHWEFPERQPEHRPRERSVEHRFLTPVFGTSCPPKGLSGVLRKLAYRRWSEGQLSHWLMLMLADRVDALESHLRSFVTMHPDNPVTETGLRAELTRGGWNSRFGTPRADRAHQALDPLIVAGPWVLPAVGGVVLVRRLVRSRGG